MNFNNKQKNINNKKIIFIASYPKSGNTWLRSIIASLLYKPDGKFNFLDIKKISLLSQFRNFKNIKGYKLTEEKNLDFNWTSQNWILAQERINYTNKDIKFYKTHCVRGIVNNNFFTDESVCLGFIYIVRDPRDVVVSLSKHMGIDKDLAINEMLYNQRRMALFDKVYELVSTWKDNINSWMMFKNVPRLIIKYEDMINNIDSSILQIANFINNISSLNIKTDKNFLDSVIQSTNFNKLQKMEDQQKFDEATSHSRFFRKGIAGGWKKELTRAQAELIEKELNINLKKLGYL